MLKKFIKNQPPARLITLGFGTVILIGSILLMLPCCLRSGVDLSYIDALYTSTSAVCVTGLLPVDCASTFTPLGQFVIALLIQTGGLGVASIGAGFIMLIGKKFDLKSRTLVKEAMNLGSGKGIAYFVRDVFITTLIIEFIGAVFSFFVFVKDFPWYKAMGVSAFHSVSAFNNAGFDILGGGKWGKMVSLTPYQSNILLNIVTSALIILGGIGFLVIKEIIAKKFKWKKFSMHTKVVLTMSAFLIVFGTLLLKLTDDMSWLQAFFQSVSTRTAGFSTYNLGTVSTAGILIMSALMFVGASPGSTGGGIKTTTLFCVFQGIKSAATNKSEKAFHYSLPKNAFRKAAIIFLLALSVAFSSIVIFAMFEPNIPLKDIIFEVVSAVATVGLSTGITPTLGVGAKILSIILMFIGRLGPLTIATLWYFSRGERVRYPEGNITIG